jgi:Cof subfamily protein (haloacid dehalogenase superfamily)
MFKMVITDLDGTLLRDDQLVGDTDLNSLRWLGKNGFIRVIATGRSPFSFSRVIPDDFPIDYLVFSSGAGVMDWKTREILISHSLNENKVRELALMFRTLEVDFKVLAPIPDNHYYVYYQNGEAHPDFLKRMEYYRGFEKEICFDPPNFNSASQFLVILPDDPSRYDELKALCNGVKVVRATSPIDHKSIWMEVFNPLVSKAEGVRFLCEMLDIEKDDTISIGNDFNDLDLLAFTGKSYVVRNSPGEIKDLYPTVNSNNEGGFSDMLQKEKMISS